ncbi:hypothetical protein EVAR_69694_1 [Eumeta japonica]|uniref:Uncharacterized protein n=1 Tax=Eumeta variegata TaxID=151549 RepID=A0A4C1ZYG1_EUMVA|nr:hypothetical protein EVAR_69694_1 [Eumeta japonica]
MIRVRTGCVKETFLYEHLAPFSRWSDPIELFTTPCRLLQTVDRGLTKSSMDYAIDENYSDLSKRRRVTRSSSIGLDVRLILRRYETTAPSTKAGGKRSKQHGSIALFDISSSVGDGDHDNGPRPNYPCLQDRNEITPPVCSVIHKSSWQNFKRQKRHRRQTPPLRFYIVDGVERFSRLPAVRPRIQLVPKSFYAVLCRTGSSWGIRALTRRRCSRAAWLRYAIFTRHEIHRDGESPWQSSSFPRDTRFAIIVQKSAHGSVPICGKIAGSSDALVRCENFKKSPTSPAKKNPGLLHFAGDDGTNLIQAPNCIPNLLIPVYAARRRRSSRLGFISASRAPNHKAGTFKSFQKIFGSDDPSTLVQRQGLDLGQRPLTSTDANVTTTCGTDLTYSPIRCKRQSSRGKLFGRNEHKDGANSSRGPPLLEKSEITRHGLFLKSPPRPLRARSALTFIGYLVEVRKTVSLLDKRMNSFGVCAGGAGGAAPAASSAIPIASGVFNQLNYSFFGASAFQIINEFIEKVF